MRSSVERTTIHHNRHARRAQGFSLIEVLVSMLVLTIGLIGAAMMQLHAFRTTEQSNFQDTAVTLARQIADEIRANNIEMNKPPGANPFLPLSFAAPGSPGATATNCYTGSCSAAAMAAQNIVEWKRRIADILPDGRLEICRDATPVNANGDFVWCDPSGAAPGAGPITIKVGWSARTPDGKGADANQPPQVALLVTPLSQ